MALLFCDSFDHYATAQLAMKWFSATDFTIGAYGRNGTNGLRSTHNDSYAYKNLAAGIATIYAGFAFKTSALSYVQPIFAAIETSTQHVDIRIDITNGKIYATRNGTTLGTSANTVDSQRVGALPD